MPESTEPERAALLRAEDERLSAALGEYHRTILAARPADDEDEAAWADFDAVDASAWGKYRSVFWQVQDARAKRYPRESR